jgi:hypothetical protein
MAARRRGSIEIERHRSIQDSRKFYKRLKDVRRPFELQVAMCRAKNGKLSTNKNQVLARWKEHFHEGSVSMRDDGVDIDLPSRQEIEGALKYLKNNNAAGAARLYKDLTTYDDFTFYVFQTIFFLVLY